VRSIYRAHPPSNSRAPCHSRVIEMSILVNMLSSHGLAKSSWASRTPVGMLSSQASCCVVATESRLLCGRGQHVADEFPAPGVATGQASAGREDFTLVGWLSGRPEAGGRDRCSRPVLQAGAPGRCPRGIRVSPACARRDRSRRARSGLRTASAGSLVFVYSFIWWPALVYRQHRQHRLSITWPGT
jgi:hypothetical protein